MKDSRAKFSRRTVDGIVYARTWHRGRWHSLGRHDSPEAREKYDAIVREWERDQQTRADARALTVGAFAVRYIAHVEERYRKYGRPTSEVPNQRTMLRWMVKLFRGVPLRDLHAWRVHEFQTALVASGKYNRRTINQHVGRLRHAVRWAVGLRLIPPDVVTSLECAESLRRGQSDARQPGDIGPVAFEDVQAVLPHLPRGMQGAIRFQLHSGARPGEALALRERDIDAKGDVWTFTPRTHKTEHHDRSRLVMIGPRARAVVEEYLAGNPAEFLFVTRAGKPYTRSGYRTQIRRTCERIGVALWNPSQLRHTVATEVRKRFGLEAAQVALGHASANVTEVYAERDQVLAMRVAREIG